MSVSHDSLRLSGAVRHPPMRIPLVRPDLPALEEIESALRAALLSGRVSNFSRYSRELETRAGDYVGREAMAVANGTTGLILALSAVGVGRDSVVVLPSFTFAATVQAVLACGARPLFCDIGEDLTLSAADLERILQRNRGIRCVVPVHVFGQPCDVAAIEEVVASARRRWKFEVPVIYDAAHAFGATVGGKRVGSFGKAEVFSLSATKIVVAGEGGLVTCSNPALLRRLRVARNYGLVSENRIAAAGLNGKLSEFAAIVALANLQTLEERLEQRLRHAACLAELIVKRTCSTLPLVRPDVRHVYKDFTILLPPRLARRRREVIGWLQDEGVETRAYFWPPLHRQAVLRKFATETLPMTDRMAARVLTIPLHTSMRAEEMSYVADRLAAAERRFGSE